MRKDAVRYLLVMVPLAGLALPLARLAVAAPGQAAGKPAAGAARTKPATPAKAAAPASDVFEKSVRPFVAKYCVSCHGDKSNTADVNLQVFRTAASVGKDPHTWEKVVQKLRSGEMPPEGSPKPAAAAVKTVTAWIEGEFARLDREARPDPGRVTARRLNRAEYNNTMRDLLGIDLRPADDFPQDDSGYGFDNIGDVLTLSPVLMERYLQAAEKVTRTALFGPPAMKPTLQKVHPPDRSHAPITTPPTEYDTTGLSLPGALHGTFRIPATGEYVVRVVLGGSRPLRSEPARVGVWVDGNLAGETSVDPEEGASFTDTEQNFSGKGNEVRVKLTAGDRWMAASLLYVYEGLPAEYGGPKPSQRPALPPRPDPEPPADATPEEAAEFRRRIAAWKAKRREKKAVNQAKVRVLEIAGPYTQEKGPSPESLRRVYTCGHPRGGHQPGCERKILGDFARRAFRRPLRPGELDPYLRLVELARKQGDPFEEGICLSLQAILVSPHFLFRIERDPAAAKPGESRPIGPHALASRLSYFLWSTMPDEELLRLADRGTLSRPEVLAAQVRRMLRDPKANTLAENFAGQWLELRKLEAHKPDTERYPDWDEYLRLSMRRETELFFQHVMREDRSLLDFLDGHYTFLNEKLAGFYGVPGVKGTEFRRVDLRGTPRGGILTQASVLTVSSYSTRTSPVLRGRWILENLLNAPPPPPPPGVPNLEESQVGETASLRQQLEAHRKNPACASCHARIDPLGFGLENFDAIGAWRVKDGKFPVDASGKLPDGRSFSGPGELRNMLKTDRGAFTECLTEKLLTYALGRGLERSDRRTVKAIAAKVAAQDHRFSALVLEIANSMPFRMTRVEGTK